MYPNQATRFMPYESSIDSGNISFDHYDYDYRWSALIAITLLQFSAAVTSKPFCQITDLALFSLVLNNT